MVAMKLLDLNLDAAEINYDIETGIIIDDTLKTTNERVFAIGYVMALNIKAAYLSEYFARIALIGLTEEQLEDEGIDYDI